MALKFSSGAERCPETPCRRGFLPDYREGLLRRKSLEMRRFIAEPGLVFVS